MAGRERLEFKEFAVREVKILDEEQRIVRGWISTEDVDYQDDIMEAAGCDDSEYDGTVLAGHDSAPQCVVGAGKIVQKVPGRGVEAEWQYAKGEPGTPLLADQLWILTKTKFLKKISIGFSAIEAATEKIGDRFVRRVKKWKLFEFSPVGLAANRMAEVTAFKMMTDAMTAKSVPDLEQKVWEDMDTEIRHRIRDPGDFKEGALKNGETFATRQFEGIEGVSVIVGILKEPPEGNDPDALVVQSIRFKKDSWTMARAKAWFEKHKDQFKSFIDRTVGVGLHSADIITKKSVSYDPEQATVTLLNESNLFKSWLQDELKIGRVFSGANESQLRAAAERVSGASDTLRAALEVIAALLAQVGEGEETAPVGATTAALPLAQIAADETAWRELVKELAATIRAA